MVIIFLPCYWYALAIKKKGSRSTVDRQGGRDTTEAHCPSKQHQADRFCMSTRSTEPKALNFLLTCLLPVPWLACHLMKNSWLYLYIHLSLCSPLQLPEGQVLLYALSFSLWLQLMRNMFHGLHLAFNTNLKIRTESPLPCKRNALLQTQLPCSGHQSVILGLSSF